MLGARAINSEDHADEDQLLKLYWNRATVKRELSDLKKERYRLLDKLRDQEDTIERAREQLDGLEKLLVNPLAAANAMVYFQLRNVWRVAAQKLEQVSGDLEAELTRRELIALRNGEMARRNRRLEGIRENMARLSDELVNAQSELMAIQGEINKSNILLRFLKARKLRGRMQVFIEQQADLQRQIDDSAEHAEKIRTEPLPELESLSVEGRRSLNTAVIALAQHLVVHFSDNGLAKLARAAMSKRVTDMRFGDRPECDHMVELIRNKVSELLEDKKLPEKILQRGAQLRKQLQYRNETASKPSLFSTPNIFHAAKQDTITLRFGSATLNVNVLADDYWDLSQYLR